MFCRFWLEKAHGPVVFLYISFRCFDNNEDLINQIIQGMLCSILKILNLDNTKTPKSMITEPITDHSHENVFLSGMKKPLKTANFKVYSAVFKEP